MSLSEVAATVGAADVFVLCRVEEDRFFNIDGHGRGANWAGNVSVDPGNEPWLAGALSSGIERRRSGVPFRAFGPYWATEVAAVRGADHLIVFGGGGVADQPEENLESAAQDARASARPVGDEKLEADEAEVQQAIEALTAAGPPSLEEASVHLATTTARALSCEFGGVLLTGPPMRLFLAREGWRPAATEEEMIAALLPLKQVAEDGIYVEQDASTSPFPYRPLSFEDGLVARCAVHLGPGGEMGLLVAAHSGAAPRGFTSLCQRVARTMAHEGAALLRGATEDDRT